MATPEVSAHNNVEIAEAKKDADERFQDAVELGFQQAIVNAELDDGDGNLDRELVAEKVYDILRTKRVVDVTEDDDRYSPDTSSTKDELTTAIFTAGPTPKQAEKSDVVRKVYEKCQSAVWNLTQPGKRGNVQARLEVDKLILVRGTVFRNGNPIEHGVYVSTEEEVILREFMGPRLDKLRKLTEVIEDDFRMATGRSKELDMPLRAAIEAAMTEAAAKLPGLTLGSGDSNGRKALGE